MMNHWSTHWPFLSIINHQPMVIIHREWAEPSGYQLTVTQLSIIINPFPCHYHDIIHQILHFHDPPLTHYLTTELEPPATDAPYHPLHDSSATIPDLIQAFHLQMPQNQRNQRWNQRQKPGIYLVLMGFQEKNGEIHQATRKKQVVGDGYKKPPSKPGIVKKKCYISGDSKWGCDNKGLRTHHSCHSKDQHHCGTSIVGIMRAHRYINNRMMWWSCFLMAVTPNNTNHKWLELFVPPSRQVVFDKRLWISSAMLHQCFILQTHSIWL